ncbi:Hypothetical protein FKW44_000859 [Caligus rogercresseyi]|uniref:Uncharacterized protein n=1 Tax=Caligus rogercresseyi TaxID=217165 RepID=A0A7T8KHX9_CALRO|nr:Hypothetical protein FKW44_000859 [Caligus rogercresseyi]
MPSTPPWLPNVVLDGSPADFRSPDGMCSLRLPVRVNIIQSYWAAASGLWVTPPNTARQHSRA